MCVEYEETLRFWSAYQQQAGRYNLLRPSREERVIQTALFCAGNALEYLAAKVPLPLSGEGIRLVMERIHVGLSVHPESPCGFLGEYDKGQRLIVLYRDAIERFSPLFFQGEQDLALACMTHELFHALEDSVLGDTRAFVRSRLGLGAVLGSKTAADASEIAAHTFTRYALRLPELPVSAFGERL